MWKRIVYLKLIDKFSLNYPIEDELEEIEDA